MSNILDGINQRTQLVGKNRLELLMSRLEDGELYGINVFPVTECIALVISDIEMPEMDGYTLTSEIRRDPRLKDLYVLLHSSLSGVFNETMVKNVGADRFIPKFSADELVKELLPIIQRAGNKASRAA